MEQHEIDRAAIEIRRLAGLDTHAQLARTPVNFQKMREAFERSCRVGSLSEGACPPDLSEHPLHALYLNSETQQLWRGWKAAYVATAVYHPHT